IVVHAAPVCLVSPRCRVSDMNWSRDDQGTGRRGYHHGNLREALIRAALDLIAEKGPAGFTFADAARSAGGSSAAGYRHLLDLQGLLGAVARRGFELFEERLNRAWNEGRPDPFAAFENVGRAYLAFARAEPAFYSAMFEAGLPFDGDPDLREAADRAFSVLRRAADAFGPGVPGGPPPPALMMSLHLWALAHGIASLFGRADGGRRKLPMSPEELLEAGVLVYLRGLSLIDEPPKS